MADDDLRRQAVTRGAFFDEARRAYQENRGVLAVAVHLPSLAALPGTAMGIMLYYGGHPDWAVPVSLGLVWLFYSLAQPGQLRASVLAARHQPCSMADLSRDLDRGPAVLVVNGLVAVPGLAIVFVSSLLGPALKSAFTGREPSSAAAMVAVIALVAVGVLLSLAGNRLVLAHYFAVDQRLGPVAALRASWAAMRGIGWGVGRGDWAVDRELNARYAILGPFERPVIHLVERALVYLYLAGAAELPAPLVDAPRAAPLRAVPHRATPGTPAIAAPVARGKYACPRCGAGVHAAHAGEASVDGCAACGGVWVDNATAQRLVQSNDVNVRFAANAFAGMGRSSPDTRAAVACPVCAQPLERVVVAAAGGVEIDVCRAHGTWFDRGELERVASVLAPPAELAREDTAATYARGVGNIATAAAAAVLSALTNGTNGD